MNPEREARELHYGEKISSPFSDEENFSFEGEVDPALAKKATEIASGMSDKYREAAKDLAAFQKKNVDGTTASIHNEVWKAEQSMLDGKSFDERVAYIRAQNEAPGGYHDQGLEMSAINGKVVIQGWTKPAPHEKSPPGKSLQEVHKETKSIKVKNIQDLENLPPAERKKEIQAMKNRIHGNMENIYRSILANDGQKTTVSGAAMNFLNRFSREEGIMVLDTMLGNSQALEAILNLEAEGKVKEKNERYKFSLEKIIDDSNVRSLNKKTEVDVPHGEKIIQQALKDMCIKTIEQFEDGNVNKRAILEELKKMNPSDMKKMDIEFFERLASGLNEPALQIFASAALELAKGMAILQYKAESLPVAPERKNKEPPKAKNVLPDPPAKPSPEPTPAPFIAPPLAELHPGYKAIVSALQASLGNYGTAVEDIPKIKDVSARNKEIDDTISDLTGSVKTLMSVFKMGSISPMSFPDNPTLKDLQSLKKIEWRATSFTAGQYSELLSMIAGYEKTWIILNALKKEKTTAVPEELPNPKKPTGSPKPVAPEKLPTPANPSLKPKEKEDLYTKTFDAVKKELAELEGKPLEKKIDAVLALTPYKKEVSPDSFLVPYNVKQIEEYNAWLKDIQSILKANRTLSLEQLREKFHAVFVKNPMNPTFALQSLDFEVQKGRKATANDTNVMERVQKVRMLYDYLDLEMLKEDLERIKKLNEKGAAAPEKSATGGSKAQFLNDDVSDTDISKEKFAELQAFHNPIARHCKATAEEILPFVVYVGKDPNKFSGLAPYAVDWDGFVEDQIKKKGKKG